MAKPTPERTPQAKLVQIVKDLDAALIEKTDDITLVATTIVANSALLFVSPPGSAKSFLIESFFRAISDANKPFVYVMGKFTEPKDLFGPVDILALKSGKNKRVTKGMLTEAPAVFLDEIWKSSTSAANLLLRVVNERRADTGEGDQPIPARAFFFASNEHPQDGELGAIYDRCVIRKNTTYVTKKSSRSQLLRKMDHTPRMTTTMTLAELDRCTAEAMALEIPEDVWKLIEEIVETLIAPPLCIRPSDRRLPLVGKIVRAYAYVQGASEVTADHLEVLQHVLWVDQSQALKVSQVIAKIANPSGMVINDVLQQAEDVVANEKAPMETITKLKDLSVKLSTLPESPARQKAVAWIWELEKQAGYRKNGLLKRDLVSSLTGR